ncbi:unnamed protein product [Effrenium voratum]|nr:unnamed protein product [Effrenium voratum]
MADRELYNVSLVAKSLDAMFLVLEQHVNALAESGENESTTRLRNTANDARRSVASILADTQQLQASAPGTMTLDSGNVSAGTSKRSMPMAEVAGAIPADRPSGSASSTRGGSEETDGTQSSKLQRAKSGVSETDGAVTSPSASSNALEFSQWPVSEDIDSLSWVSQFVIYPGWTSKLVWDLAVMVVVLLDTFVLPFQLSFKRDVGEDAFDGAWFWITTVCFSADILVTFNTGLTHGSDDKEVIIDHALIARAYLRGWFSLDFLSTFPWSRMVDALVGSEGGALLHVAKLAKMLKFLRIIRLMKMLRAKKIKDIWERLEIRIGSVTVIQAMYLIRVLLVIVAICHWNACIFWMIGRPDSIITDFLPDDTRMAFEALPHWTTVSRTYGLGQASWTYAELPMAETYIFCFYWTLGVMRTMPAEVTPVNLAERTFVLCFMFFALSAFAVSVASLTQAYFKISERNRGFNDEMFALRMHMHKLKLEDSAQRKIKDYVSHLFHRRRIMAKEANFLSKLPEPLHMEVRYAEALQYVQKLGILSDFKKETIRQICLQAASSDLLADQKLCVAGEEALSAWILCSGHLFARDVKSRPRELSGDPIIIDEACLETEEPVLSHLTVVTASTCSVIRIDKLVFASIAGMSLSKKRREKLVSLTEAEGPDQIEPRLKVGSFGGHVGAAEVLLNAKADPNAQAEDGSTPLHGAAERGHAQVAELLLTHGVNYQSAAAGGRTPLHVAAERGFAEVVEALLANGSDPEERTEEARTALICAAARGHVAAVAKLLDYQADVQALDKMSQTALHAAAVGGKAECIILLHKKRARLEQKDGSGRTPMQLALDAKQEGGIRALLKLRAVMPEDVAQRPDMQPLIREVEREVLLEQLREAEELCGKQQLKDAEQAFEDARQHLLHLIQLSETARVTPVIQDAEIRLGDLEEQARVCRLEASRTQAKIKEMEAELARLATEQKEQSKDLALLRRDLDTLRDQKTKRMEELQRLKQLIQQMIKEGADVTVRYRPFIIDPNTNQTGEDKQDYCRRRGWGGGWKPGDLKQWKWWPNTENAHRLTFYLDEIHSKMPELSSKERDERCHALIRKFYELTYDRDCNISTPEGAAQAIEELGYGSAADAATWLKQGGGIREVNESLRRARQDQIGSVPHYSVKCGDREAPGFGGAQSSRTFYQLFQELLR